MQVEVEELRKEITDMQNLLEELNNAHGGKVGEIALRRKTTKSSKEIVDGPVDIERREKVKEAMLHAWGTYEKYPWGQDELQDHSVVLEGCRSSDCLQ
ncbi:mannosyl-oligosaccharide 1,2-alpha-mannosidase MNS1-like isoform X2 [Arachis ipaensis]|uniref:mannosyl-oligosaccharide 1,2-alpha-mannosidase MNS1-like isoform X2 n=1 Tax=Arachis ipaensis TaxID=130454 RepID=UPI000A2B83E2|nr:mannosyl-oligosaccharide 1,2-alpha-mannosidase MNS1-like isoform X2 [Arachis ipaensis]